MQETQIRSPGWEDPLKKEMATHSSILAWRISRTEEPSGLQSMGVTESRTGPSYWGQRCLHLTRQGSSNSNRFQHMEKSVHSCVAPRLSPSKALLEEPANCGQWRDTPGNMRDTQMASQDTSTLHLQQSSWPQHRIWMNLLGSPIETGISTMHGWASQAAQW